MLAIIILVTGAMIFLYGVLISFGFIKTDVSGDSEIDKKLLTEKERYFWGRYNAGLQLIAAGAVAIFLGVTLYLA